MMSKEISYKSKTDWIYGMGVWGAGLYFIQSAHNFGEVMLAILSAFAWPAWIVYKALEVLLKSVPT